MHERQFVKLYNWALVGSVGTLAVGIVTESPLIEAIGGATFVELVAARFNYLHNRSEARAAVFTSHPDAYDIVADAETVIMPPDGNR